VRRDGFILFLLAVLTIQAFVNVAQMGIVQRSRADVVTSRDALARLSLEQLNLVQQLTELTNKLEQLRFADKRLILRAADLGYAYSENGKSTNRLHAEIERSFPPGVSPEDSAGKMPAAR